jgi:hypothetical protein
MIWGRWGRLVGNHAEDNNHQHPGQSHDQRTAPPVTHTATLHASEGFNQPRTDLGGATVQGLGHQYDQSMRVRLLIALVVLLAVAVVVVRQLSAWSPPSASTASR